MTARVKQMVEANWFHRTIVAVILLAGVLAGLETSAAVRERHGSLLRLIDALVLGVFIVEMALKLAAHGRKPWLYFHDGWNVFDFAIVVLCCLPMDSQVAAVLRLARGLRLLRQEVQIQQQEFRMLPLLQQQVRHK